MINFFNIKKIKHYKKGGSYAHFIGIFSLFSKEKNSKLEIIFVINPLLMI